MQGKSETVASSCQQIHASPDVHTRVLEFVTERP